MKNKFVEEISIPEGITCEVSEDHFICKNGDSVLQRKIGIKDTKLEIKGNTVVISSDRTNKSTIARIRSLVAHMNNMFRGLKEGFVYEMEICYVHFPMTVKVEGDKVVVGNFLGEKEKRFANIIKGVKVEVKDKKIIVSGQNLESTGQTAANIEKATSISYRDRRVFQDGIFMIVKKGRSIL